MGKKKKSSALSHEEIWDDSALVRSWDEAVEEYKTYHSIHARGENVEEVLNQAEKESLAEYPADDDEPMDTEHGTDGAVKSNGPAQEASSVGNETQSGAVDGNTYQQEADTSNHGGALPFSAAPGAPGMPNALLGQVQDPALKNLMMAWYFAGYYTGLYEGQQQASQAANSDKNKTTPERLFEQGWRVPSPSDSQSE